MKKSELKLLIKECIVEEGLVKESNDGTKTTSEIRDIVKPLWDLQTRFEDETKDMEESEFESIIDSFQDKNDLSDDLIELVVFGRGDLSSLTDYVHYHQTGSTGVNEVKELLENIDTYVRLMRSLVN